MPDVDFIRELAAVPIATVAMFLIYRLATNHMNALARAIERMADAIDDLKDYMRRGP
ncbi:hypothetical protein LCGC14_0852230 [marine sediment metagenome]|uniref:YvrJ family protein n=1 Tax=marine sediment metagenome TaxID=412755 RepID=A0A0F9P9W6_9ZZZZ